MQKQFAIDKNTIYIEVVSQISPINTAFGDCLCQAFALSL